MFGGRFFGRRFFGLRYWGDGGSDTPPEPPVVAREVWWPVEQQRRGLAHDLIEQAKEAGQRKEARDRPPEPLPEPAREPEVIEDPTIAIGEVVEQIKQDALEAAELAELKRRDDEAAIVLLLLD